MEHYTLFLKHSMITLPTNMKISKTINRNRKIGFENNQAVTMRNGVPVKHAKNLGSNLNFSEESSTSIPLMTIS